MVVVSDLSRYGKTVKAVTFLVFAERTVQMSPENTEEIMIPTRKPVWIDIAQCLSNVDGKAFDKREIYQPNCEIRYLPFSESAGFDRSFRSDENAIP